MNAKMSAKVITQREEFPDGPPLGKLAPAGGSAAHEVASVGALFL